MAKEKKNLSYFSLLSHTQIIFLKDSNSFALSFNLQAPFFFFFSLYNTYLSFSYAAHTPKKITYNPYLNNPTTPSLYHTNIKIQLN